MRGLRAAMLGLDPHDEFKAVKVDGLVVHGTDRAIAVDFDLVVTKVVHEESPGEIETAIHVTELFVESAGWRAVAATFAPSPSPAPRPGSSFGPLAGATAPGPIAKLLGAKLEPGMVIEAVREAATPSWGVVQALVDGPHANGRVRLAAQLLAVPDGAGWRPIAVHVIPPERGITSRSAPPRPRSARRIRRACSRRRSRSHRTPAA